MTPSGVRSLWTVLTVTVVVAAALVGCATTGPITPVAVTDIKSVAGTWKGVVYRSSSEPETIEMTIREDGSYELTSREKFSTRGRGKIAVSGGRLAIHGEKGSGVATVLRSPSGDRVMRVEVTMADNSLLSASLSPVR